LNPRDVIDSRHHFIANAYPVYANDYARDVSVVREALAPIVNLETLGRAGRFVYSHLHDQLRFGKDYVRNLTGSLRASA
jgi:protoporphyrinogen oxidase